MVVFAHRSAGAQPLRFGLRALRRKIDLDQRIDGRSSHASSFYRMQGAAPSACGDETARAAGRRVQAASEVAFFVSRSSDLTGCCIDSRAMVVMSSPRRYIM